MTKTVGATYDGEKFCPDEPVDLKPNTRVTITIELPLGASNGEGSADPLEKLFGSVSLGHPIGLDNEDIDADLAREYASNHED